MMEYHSTFLRVHSQTAAPLASVQMKLHRQQAWVTPYEKYKRRLLFTSDYYIIHTYVSVRKRCKYHWHNAKTYVNTTNQMISGIVLCRQWKLTNLLDTLQQFPTKAAQNKKKTIKCTIFYINRKQHSCTKLGVGLLMVMVWLEHCTSYSSSCHDFHHL